MSAVELAASRHLDHPASELWDLLSDPEAHVAAYAEVGSRDVEVLDADVGDDVVELTIVRRIDPAVPPVVRHLVPATITVTSTDRWEHQADGSVTGRSDLAVDGLPVRAVGRAEIVDEPGGCRYDLTVAVPTPGPMVGPGASLVRGVLQHHLDAQLDAAEAVLAGR